MSGINDPFRKLKPGEPFVPVAAQFNMFIEDAQARRTQGQGVLPKSPFSDEATVKILVRNDTESDLDQYSMVRWTGPPVTAAVVGGRVPLLQFKTTDYDDSEKPIGVTLQKMRQSSEGSPAGSGRVACLGVCWARCRGPIDADDLLIPDASYQGIKDTAGGSNVRALETIVGATDAIIPVLIGAGGASVSVAFKRIYTLAIRGTADSGTISWEAKKTVIVDDEPTIVTETGDWDFDADETDIKSSLIGLDPGVLVSGGDIRWNVCKINFYDTTARLKITSTDLTREEHGITPQAELSWCAENENTWGK